MAGEGDILQVAGSAAAGDYDTRAAGVEGAESVDGMERRVHPHWYKRACRWAARVMKPSEAFISRENARASPELRRAILFSGLGVEPYQISLLAHIASVAALALALPCALALSLALGLRPLPEGLLALLAALTVPLALLVWIGGYPKALAARARVLSLGKTPEAVNYMAMAMRVSPTLDRAVAFAAENVDDPLATELRRVLWSVSMREHRSVEESFLSFAQEWGEWSDDFRRSLFAIRAGEMEASHEGLHRALDRAVETSLSGAKRTMEAYAASLSGPTFVLFTLGILLPMMLGALLPMASLGGVELGAVETALLMDLAFPISTLAFAHHILGKRPGTLSLPDIKEKESRAGQSALVAGGAAGVLLSLLGVYQMAGGPGEGWRALGAVSLLWGLSVPVAVFCLATTQERKRELARVRRIEDELPDALFQLGSRIGEGMPVEAAMERTAGILRGTEVAALFARVAFALRLTHSSLDKVLFGPGGILVGFPSRTVAAAMRMVVESVKKDNASAGRTIVGFSQYLKDLRRLDSDIRIRLGSLMDTMRTTAMFFAPLVMGITAALYAVLTDVAQGISLGGAVVGVSAAMKGSVPAHIFTGIIGVFLILTVAIITRFTSGIRWGDEPIERRRELGVALPSAMAVFSLAALAGQALIG
ncbi:MAG: hypothetical protein ACUVV6_06995 [Thermoplasmatota archaeon]